MKDEQVDRILTELASTRETFVHVVETIKWTRRNTIVQYFLIVMVFLMIFTGVFYYRSDQRNACVRGNEIRVAIKESDDRTALAIGIALTEVTGAPEDKFEKYVEVYSQQPKPEALELRDC